MRIIQNIALLSSLWTATTGFVPASTNSGSTYSKSLTQRSHDVALHMDTSEIVPTGLFLAALALTIVKSTEKPKPITVKTTPPPPPPPSPVPEVAPPPPPPPIVKLEPVVPKPAPVEPKKDVSEITMEVATSVSGGAPKLTRGEEKPPAPEPVPEPAPEPPVETKRGFLKRVYRVAKKVVAPWRKWENIE
mmetsp:Transcript_30551/g.45230  ORF Transcript_30551/g.45230 Transcript_30551/m.45230 type:complete len:190 (-) Transcript_30551:194-763(-)|eukprot:CAMPEP_0194046404 /NCGR_PEP_ID=MMETSP0009_2-20130614/21081_1 /TAXON_ID=210454 /ORGANISM="Grammatophora oceanica, Strain CCMP 410" /LENGTH=189 /DNA_ID=CAMNT_0038691675 /DNA_START=80 /DNA_END=649 /DNA_ORIENTATION=+